MATGNGQAELERDEFGSPQSRAEGEIDPQGERPGNFEGVS